MIEISDENRPEMLPEGPNQHQLDYFYDNPDLYNQDTAGVMELQGMVDRGQAAVAGSAIIVLDKRERLEFKGPQVDRVEYGSKIGAALILKQAKVRSGATVEDGVILEEMSRVQHGAVIKKDARIGRQTTIETNRVIGEGVIVPGGIRITNDPYRIDHPTVTQEEIDSTDYPSNGRNNLKRFAS